MYFYLYFYLSTTINLNVLFVCGKHFSIIKGLFLFLMISCKLNLKKKNRETLLIVHSLML
ncbi:uncharacterized protein B0P05DRAFT_527075, partial [Gilbertella persicaria]|uniref:uncharacterized protein n=1 Tax=Gilbertella persicaria TaxID=101096 RepID=UPI0022208CF5